MSASAVVKLAWMLEGRPPIAAAPRTAATACCVAAYSGFIVPWSTLPDSSESVWSRSSCRALTRTVSFVPRLASCDTRENCAALASASATRSPPKITPISSAATMTANSLRATGHSARFSPWRALALGRAPRT
jgi:hypothetical protein